MGLLSPILRGGTGNSLTWWCPGCRKAHQIRYGEGPGPRWTWNGNAEKPTFDPSVLTWHDAVPEADEAHKEWRTKRVCHSFVRDGQMQFLNDCTHAMAEQTVDIPLWPTPKED